MMIMRRRIRRCDQMMMMMSMMIMIIKTATMRVMGTITTGTTTTTIACDHSMPGRPRWLNGTQPPSPHRQDPTGLAGHPPHGTHGLAQAAEELHPLGGRHQPATPYTTHAGPTVSSAPHRGHRTSGHTARPTGSPPVKTG
jgi:hypothetical protein